MSSEMAGFSGVAANLRRTFDDAFAAPAALASTSSEGVLVIQVGGDAYAMRLSDIAGLHVNRKIEPVPSSAFELLGVAALRGQIVPIYDLGVLLGYRSRGTPRWFVLARGPKTVGLAFEAFVTQARVPQTSFADEGTESIHEHVQGAVRVGAVSRPIIRIASLIETIAARTPSNLR